MLVRDSRGAISLKNVFLTNLHQVCLVQVQQNTFAINTTVMVKKACKSEPSTSRGGGAVSHRAVDIFYACERITQWGQGYSQGGWVRQQEGGRYRWMDRGCLLPPSVLVLVFSHCLPCCMLQHELQAETSACEYFLVYLLNSSFPCLYISSFVSLLDSPPHLPACSQVNISSFILGQLMQSHLAKGLFMDSCSVLLSCSAF